MAVFGRDRLGFEVGKRLLPPRAATRMPIVPWRIRDGLLVLGGGLLFLVAALIATLGVFELQADTADEGARAAISTLVSTGFFLFMLWMIWMFIVRRYHSSWRTLGLRAVSWQWLAAVPFIYALLTFLFVLMFRGMVTLFGPTVHWPAPLTTATVSATQQPVLEALVIVTGVILTPVVEELVFRGVIYQALRRTMPVSSATVISAVIFAAMHLNIVLFIPLTAMGIVLALVYERSNSLLPTILVHACNNGIILLIIAGSQPTTL